MNEKVIIIDDHMLCFINNGNQEKQTLEIDAIQYNYIV